jgi:hypothetical protein
MMRIASEFGFTPASRSRISTPPPDQLPFLDLAADDYQEDESEGGGQVNLWRRIAPRTGPSIIQGFFPSLPTILSLGRSGGGSYANSQFDKSPRNPRLTESPKANKPPSAPANVRNVGIYSKRAQRGA